MSWMSWIHHWKGKDYVHVHGSPFDRGAADSYYDRPQVPHYWPGGTGVGDMVPHDKMTPDQIEEYYAGYSYNEHMGIKKTWDYDRNPSMTEKNND